MKKQYQFINLFLPNAKSTPTKQSLTIAQQLGIKEFPFVIKDKYGRVIYFENSCGYWQKTEYDESGKEIYHEDSNGVIRDNRPKPQIELTKQEIADKFGIDVNLLTIVFPLNLKQ